MRSSARRLFSLLLALLAFTVVLHAQTPDSLRSVVLSDSTNVGISSVLFLGVIPLPRTELNAYLRDQGFDGTLFSDDLLDGSIGIGALTQIDVRSFMLGVGASLVFPQETFTNRGELRLRMFEVQLDLGIPAVRGERGLVVPMLSLGARLTSLQIDENDPRSFDDLLDATRGSRIDVSNASLHLELGVSAEYLIPLAENDMIRTSLAIGLRGGYLIGLADRWEVSGGPDMSASGIRLGLIVGTRSEPRKYRARIVSEVGQ